MKSHVEHTLQKSCVMWFRYAYPKYSRLLFAVPNGGARSVTTGAILKAEGVVRGVADLLLLIPTRQYHGLAIEMKAPKGRQSAEQREWQRAVENMGYKYVVCRTPEEFMSDVNAYLSNR